jgi:pimeloyl-ACP methyl ester carboxylesterase
VTLRTRDDVRLAGTFLPGPEAGAVPGTAVSPGAVLIAHGFAAHRRKPAYLALADRLALLHPVLSLDLRGHGEARGRSTFGDLEVHDVRAGVAWLRREGFAWVGAVGVSMGATAVLRAAGAGPAHALDAVCAVSAPASFRGHATPAVAVLQRIVSSAGWRLAVRAALGIRVAPRWGDPVDALRVVAGIAPTPLLLVHGRDDHYLPLDHARRLLHAAHQPKALWIEPSGFGHAEDGLTAAFADRLGHALVRVRVTGAWPARTS